MTFGTNGLQFQDNPGRGFPVASAILQYLLVKYPNAVLTLCAKDANDDMIGVTMEPRPTISTGPIPTTVPVRFRSAGSIPCTTAAAETIEPGDLVYKQAAGQVGKASTGSVRVGIALTFATAAGQWIEVLPF